MSYRRTAILAGFVVALVGQIRAADIAGKWHAEFNTQIGTQKYTYTFTVKDGTITGTAAYDREGQTGTVKLKDIKLNGDQISFTEPLQLDDQEVSITYHGTVSGDEMKLTRLVGEFATEELTATRVKEAPAPTPPAGT